MDSPLARFMRRNRFPDDILIQNFLRRRFLGAIDSC